MRGWTLPKGQVPAGACGRAVPPCPSHTPSALEKRKRASVPLAGGRHCPGMRAVLAPLRGLSVEVASNSEWKCKSLSFFLFSHHRFRILWDEEVERVGPEEASLGRVVWKFQRTRVLMDIVANILCIIMAAVGPVSGGGPSPTLSHRSPDWRRMALVTFSTSWWV